MSDLISELREHERDYPELIHGPLCGKAADEIERCWACINELMAKNDQQRKQLVMENNDGPNFYR